MLQTTYQNFLNLKFKLEEKSNTRGNTGIPEPIKSNGDAVFKHSLLFFALDSFGLFI